MSPEANPACLYPLGVKGGTAYPSARSSRATVAVIVAAAIAATALVVASRESLSAYLFATEDSPAEVVAPLRFDATAWRAAAGSAPEANARRRMLDDLLANHLRLGASRPRVFDLLGAPDQQFVPFAPRTFSYDIGRYRRCPWTSLILRFNRAGTLAEIDLTDGLASCRNPA